MTRRGGTVTSWLQRNCTRKVGLQPVRLQPCAIGTTVSALASLAPRVVGTTVAALAPLAPRVMGTSVAALASLAPGAVGTTVSELASLAPRVMVTTVSELALLAPQHDFRITVWVFPRKCSSFSAVKKQGSNKEQF